jgi:hypothetical protein
MIHPASDSTSDPPPVDIHILQTYPDTLMPHPINAKQHCVSILNPSTRTFDDVVKPLLPGAHSRTAAQYARSGPGVPAGRLARPSHDLTSCRVRSRHQNRYPVRMCVVVAVVRRSGVPR